MATKPAGRRRADVEINVLDQIEKRSRQAFNERQGVRARRALAKEAKRLERRERMLAEALNPVTGAPKQARGNRVIAAISSRTSFAQVAKVFGSMSVAGGLFATVALPAYAFSPDVVALSGLASQATANSVLGADVDTQGLSVSDAVKAAHIELGTYKTAKISEVQRNRWINAYKTYIGPTVADYLENPPYSQLTSAQIIKVAAKYVETPYIFGGDNPRGFDCSGYVMFVFSQFGIALPHSVRGQDWLAHERDGAIYVKAEDAVPGDVVVWNDGSHDGIYAGGGMLYHAPRPGDRVKLATIFSPNVHYIRFGIKK